MVLHRFAIIFTKLIADSCLVGILLIAAACSSAPEIPVDGRFNSLSVQTTVDSEIARYYLERHNLGAGKKPSFDQTIVGLQTRYGKSVPSREQLLEISQQHSVDLATLIFANALLQDSCNATLNKSFQHHLTSNIPLKQNESRPYLLLFVPGWDYRENGSETGANLASLRQLATLNHFEN